MAAGCRRAIPGQRGMFLLVEAAKQLRNECGPRQVHRCRIGVCERHGRLHVVDRHRDLGEEPMSRPIRPPGHLRSKHHNRRLDGRVSGTARGEVSSAHHATASTAAQPLLLSAAVLPRLLEHQRRMVDAAGTGTALHVFHCAQQRPIRSSGIGCPYVVAIVELDEGPRMETNLVDCHHESIVVGMRVEVIFEDEGEIVLPRFRPQNP